jgi:hypothetical protein
MGQGVPMDGGRRRTSQLRCHYTTVRAWTVTGDDSEKKSLASTLCSDGFVRRPIARRPLGMIPRGDSKSLVVYSTHVWDTAGR